MITMSFADIIRQEQERLERQNNDNDKVVYPTTKHDRLYFSGNTREVFVQVLPAPDLVSAFAVPIRRIFLQAKSSQGKDINANFILDPDFNPGSLLDNKIKEWADKGMIPNRFGGQQTPRRFYLLNVVQVVNQNGQYIQERDQEGNLVVRVLELPQSGYQNLIRKLADPLYNTSGSELSFMDINKPSLVKITKPAQGQMEYAVEVYTNITLPPLGHGWENQLENLNALATPTERLENGDKWVQAFVDMKEGRKPNQNNNEGTKNQNPTQNVSQHNPYASVAQTQSNPMPNQQSNTTFQPQTSGSSTEGMVNSGNANSNAQNPWAGVNVTDNDLPTDFGPTQPQQQPQSAPSIDNAPKAPEQPIQPAQPATPQQHNSNQPPQADENNNGLQDIDALLQQELGNL